MSIFCAPWQWTASYGMSTVGQMALIDFKFDMSCFENGSTCQNLPSLLQHYSHERLDGLQRDHSESEFLTGLNKMF